VSSTGVALHHAASVHHKVPLLSVVPTATSTGSLSSTSKIVNTTSASASGSLEFHLMRMNHTVGDAVVVGIANSAVYASANTIILNNNFLLIFYSPYPFSGFACYGLFYPYKRVTWFDLLELGVF